MLRISATPRRLIVRGLLITASVALVAGTVRVMETQAPPNLGATHSVGALQPSTGWVSWWSHHVPLGGEAAGSEITTARVLNPANPLLGGEPSRVEITLYVGKCGSPTIWGSSLQTIAPGAIGSFSSYPPPAGKTAGLGCVHINSSLPVVPINGAITDTVANPVAGSAESTTRHMDFTPVDWNLGGPGQTSAGPANGGAMTSLHQESATNWVSYYEHTPSYVDDADNYTIGYLLNPADPTITSRAASVTTTFYYGACGASTTFKRSTETIEAGSMGSFSSHGGLSLGSGCVLISSNLPIVPLNGHIHDSGPLGLGLSSIEMHMDFVPVEWSL
jgi:hypothetical protein